MLIYDKIENEIIKTDTFDLSSIIEKQNITISNLYFDRVQLCSLNDLKLLKSDDVISENDYSIAKLNFDKIQGSQNFKDLKVFVFVDTEKKKSITTERTETDANKLASKIANDIVIDYTGDVVIDVEIYADKEHLLQGYCENITIIDYIVNK